MHFIYKRTEISKKLKELSELIQLPSKMRRQLCSACPGGRYHWLHIMLTVVIYGKSAGLRVGS